MKGLLKAAIRDNNPVISFESSRLMGRKGPVPEEDYAIPLGQADVKREGSDVTVIALAWLVHEALVAAEELAAEGVSVEIVRSPHAWCRSMQKRSATRCRRRVGS
jgi:pyruvate/2-oxoglutarate/acetoin dehydrogenase E1 component